MVLKEHPLGRQAIDVGAGLAPRVPVGIDAVGAQGVDGDQDHTERTLIGGATACQA